MKTDLHPKYHHQAKITCACGNEFVVGSSKEKIDIELCHMCHPFYTGQQKLVDTAGVVDRFKARMAKSAEKKDKNRSKRTKLQAKGKVKKATADK
ncbi:TPA: 50S ribosomal protein L31 [Candidatus Falkowbacteria bacterium]|nr:50S ribosomal protein L31 [Candidatus Falkowbacteria bacterium]